MSNQLSSKRSAKPLKGGSVTSNIGVFDTVSANTLKLESISIAGVFEDGILLNVVIQDSVIENTTIGLQSPANGFFADLSTFQEVNFFGNQLNKNVNWDQVTCVLTVNGEFEVNGCSRLGNIKICNNDITAVNIDGDINVIPNGIGTVYVRGPLYHTTSSGNLYSDVSRGRTELIARDDVTLTSSSASFAVSSFAKSTIQTSNGDITLSTLTDSSTKNVASILVSGGNLRVATNSYHRLTTGNTVTISNAPGVSGSYTVSSILNDLTFIVTPPQGFTLGSTVTTGTVQRTSTNDVYLSASRYVRVPANIPVTFGATTNNVCGNTGGIVIASGGDVRFNVSSSNVVNIPQSTPLQFGTSGSIVHTGSQLSVNSTVTSINSTHTRFTDPVLTIADYQLASNDGKDRGIEYRYFDTATSAMKLGWFGYKSATQSFTFIPDAVNSGEVISGSIGNFELNAVRAASISLLSNGTIDANCGTIVGVSSIIGCTGNLRVRGTDNVTVESGSRISLAASGDVLIPSGTPLKFGTIGSSITHLTSTGNLVMSSLNNVVILTQTAGSVTIPTFTRLTFDGTTSGAQHISGDTAGALNINSNANVKFGVTAGSVQVPTGTPLELGNAWQRIVGTTSGALLESNKTLDIVGGSHVYVRSTAGSIVLAPTVGSVRIPSGRVLAFDHTGDSFTSTTNSVSHSNGTLFVSGGGNAAGIQVRHVGTVDLGASQRVSVPNDVPLTFGTDGSKAIQGNTAGTLMVFAPTVAVTSATLQCAAAVTHMSSASLFLNAPTAIVTTGQCVITGTVGSRLQVDTEHVRIKDPIITLAHAGIDNTRDRGVEYRYDADVSLGWFGYKRLTERFTYYKSAINTAEVISGTVGDMEMSTAFINSGIQFATAGTLNLACGTIANVRTIAGCENNVTITSGSIALSAKDKVVVPFNTLLSFGTTQNAVSADTAGTVYLSGTTFVINANVQVNGTTTSVYSTVTNLQDPIISIGGVTGPIVNDAKDRGIEFKWNDGVASKTGFFGYKNALARFVFVRDGTNVNEVFTGAYSDVQFGNAYMTNIDLSSGGGVVSGVRTITGGTAGNTSIVIQPGTAGSVIIPSSVPLAFGSKSNTIYGTSSGTLYFGVSNETVISTGALKLSKDAPIWFGTSDSVYSSAGNLVLASQGGDVLLRPEGVVDIPAGTALTFGSTSNMIYSDGNELLIVGYQGINLSSGTLYIGGDVNITGTLSATTNVDFDVNAYILPLGTFQQLDITHIENGATPGTVRVTTLTNGYLAPGDTVTLRNTTSEPAINGTYTVQTAVAPNVFTIYAGVTLTSAGNMGTVKANLTTYQGKDVGIGVNYWSTAGGASATAGSINYRTGFFGFKHETERWTFYKNASIVNNVATGTLGSVQVDQLVTNRISGFTLEGTLAAGSNAVVGSNVQVSGGFVEGTPIGVLFAAPGRFSTLSNTVSASLANVTLQSSLAFNAERYSLSSAFPTRNPGISNVLSMFSVTGVNFTNACGTMPSTSVADGTYKIMMCSSMGEGCTYTLYFGAGKLLAPNPLSSASQPTKLVFKRRSQSVQMVFDAVQSAWILVTGAYVG